MFNKKIIKKVFDQKINKEEIKNQILEKNNSNLNIYKLIIPVTIMLILIGTIFITGNQNKELDTKNITKNIININEVDKTTDGTRAAIDMHDTRIESFETIDLDLDIISDVKVPSDLFDRFYHKIYIKNYLNSSVKDEYNILHSYELHYGNQKDRFITLTFSSKYEPFRDYYFGTSGNKSIINGTDVEIWKNGKTYLSLFKYKDYNFDIETIGISEIELIDLLISIIK